MTLDANNIWASISMKWNEIVVITITAVLAVAVFGYRVSQQSGEVAGIERLPVPSNIPDFSSYTDVRKKKEDFFEFMLPMIRNANAAVLAERELVAELARKIRNGETLSKRERNRLSGLLKKYRIKAAGEPTETTVDELLKRVDVVPASLILAQAANESAWGTSRFATQANNFFGIWCFEPGCGVTPRYRDDGLTHEVKKFASVQQGVSYYLQTINSNPAYRQLREIRARLREDQSRVLGVALAEGLARYSERGSAYVEELQAMIEYNKLQRYSTDFSTQLADSG